MLGSVFGAALGDAIGAPFEFTEPEEAARQTGSQWIDGLYPCCGAPGPHGVWQAGSPAGTGTDDTRYNWMFLRLAARLRRMPCAEVLAQWYLHAYERPQSFFPDCVESARDQFRIWEPVCRGCLGQSSSVCPDVRPSMLRERSIGLNYPTLIGLITLTGSGLLFPGRPREAYVATYETDFYDVGYAREATAVLAGAISMAIAGKTARTVCAEATVMDPLALGGDFGGPFVTDRLPALLREAPENCLAEELADDMSQLLAACDAFDPLRALALAFAAVRAFPNDPVAAILVAVNHRAVDRRGRIAGFLDVDCYGCVTGALAGAVCGLDKFPRGLLWQVARSNKAVYGIDLEQTASAIADHFH